MNSITEGKEYPKKDFTPAATIEANKRYPDLPYVPKNDEPTYTPHFLRDREGGCFIEGSDFGYTLGRKEQREEDLKERQWISVKDHLPENTEDVLCAMLNYSGKKVIQFVGCYTKGHEIEYCDDDYQGEYDEFEDKHGTLYLKPGWYENEETPGSDYDEQWLKREVIAWMPLPEPPALAALTEEEQKSNV